MKRARASLGAVSVAIAIALASEARADDPIATKPDNRARAQELFDSALDDAEAGNFGAACPKFLASQEADPKTSTLLNLANCYEKNGQTASAWGAFREAEVLARKAGRSDWEAAARARADAIEPKLVRLSITLPPAHRIDGLVITRDGARIAPGELDVAIPVDPGEHVVTATAEGRVAWETRIKVAEQSSTVEIPLLEAVPAPPPSPPQREPRPAPVTTSRGWSVTRTTGAVLAGAGAAGLVASGILGIVAQADYDDARARCRDGVRGCPAGAVADADEAYGLATGATVVFVVGAVLLAGGATLFVLGGDGKHAASTPSPTRSLGVGTRGLRVVF